MSIDDTRDDRPTPQGATTEPDEASEDQLGLLDTFIGEQTTEVSDDRAVTSEHGGRYRYEELEIGRGGLGRVLGAFDVHLGRGVAVKELLPERRTSSAGQTPTDTDHLLIRFLREARVTAQLEHPNIVPVYELGRRKDQTLYYTMKYVRGRTLKSALEETHELADRLKLLGHFVDLCNAIAYAHSRGVIHRDIKPDNVMIGEFGETVVLDWGVAKVRGKEDLRVRELARSIELMQDEQGIGTMPGAAFGTPAYMSPEQAEGQIEQVDERSDVWSLGVVLYQILTGKLPFSGRHLAELMLLVTKGEFHPIARICPEAPRELAAVAEHALRFNPSERYQTARELAEEIEAYRSGAKVEVYEYTNFELLHRFVERNRSALAVGLIAVLALVAVIGAAYVRLLGERDRAIAAEQTSRANLADAYVEKGRVLEKEKDWISVALLAAGALDQAEHPAARGLLANIDGRWRPQSVWQERTYAGCAAIAHDPKADELACATSWGVQLWRGSTGEALARLETKGGWIHSLAYSPDGATLAAGGDGEIALFDDAARTITATKHGHQGGVVALAWSRDGRVLASAGEDGTVRLWGDGAIAWRGEGPVKRLAYATTGDVLVFADSAGNLHRQTTDALRTIESPRAHRGPITALAMAADGTFATAGVDRTVRIWTLEGGEPLSIIGPIPTGIQTLAFSSAVLHAGGNDGVVRRFSNGELEARFIVHERAVRSTALSPDGGMLFTAGEDRMVRAFKIPKPRPPLTLELGDDVRGLGFAQTTDALAIAVGKQLLIFDAKTGDEVQKVDMPGDGEGPIAFTNDWVRLAAASADAIRLIDSDEGVQVTLRGHEGSVTALGFGKDTLVSGGADETVRVWARGDKKPTRTLKAPIDDVSAVAASADASLIAAADARGRIVFWRESQAGLHHRIEAEGRVRALAFSPDGTRFAVAADRRVSVYDTRTWELLLVMEAQAKVQALAFSRPGRRLAIAAGRTVRVIRLRTLQRERSHLLREMQASYGVRLDGLAVVPRL